MRIVLALIAGLVLALAGAQVAHAADLRVVTIGAAEDMSLPFSCDWSYDWEARCYRDDSDRLGIGGVDDKIWRAALRFSLAALPPQAIVVTAELSLWYDRTCVAPRKRSRPCDGREYDLDVHPIFTQRWLAEREVEFGPTLATAAIEPFAPPNWLVWDVTDLVGDWHSGGLPNFGLLLKLSDGQEEFNTSGPYVPSSSYANASLRPRLTVWYAPG
jgi:hypothetical protein